jgi:hypothetical protein
MIHGDWPLHLKESNQDISVEEIMRRGFVTHV